MLTFKKIVEVEDFSQAKSYLEDENLWSVGFTIKDDDCLGVGIASEQDPMSLLELAVFWGRSDVLGAIVARLPGSEPAVEYHKGKIEDIKKSAQESVGDEAKLLALLSDNATLKQALACLSPASSSFNLWTSLFQGPPMLRDLVDQPSEFRNGQQFKA